MRRRQRSFIEVGLVALVALAAGFAPRPADSATSPIGKIVRRDPRLDRLIAPGVSLEKIADGFHWVEGPVWDRSTGALFFSDIPANAVFRWKEGSGAELFLQPSGYTGTAPFSGREPGSNGLTLDALGRLVLCQHGNRSIARREMDGTITVLAERYQGKRLNSPNDLVFKSNGDLYFTDPPFGLPKAFDDPAKELPFSGVFRLGKDGRLTLLTSELTAPNGLAFSPDEKTLYVSNADARRAVWMAYPVLEDGTLGAGRVFHDATPWTGEGPGLPDGFKVDRAGNLFAAGPNGLHVFAPDGTRLGSIETGVPTANCNWGGDGSVLYLTVNTAVARIATLTLGAAHQPKR